MYWIIHITVEYFRRTEKVRIEFKFKLKISTQQSDLLEEAFSLGPSVLFLEDLCYISYSGSPSTTFSQF